MEYLKKNRRFAFLYDGKPMDDWEFDMIQKQQGNTLTTTYTFSDGLKITNVARKLEKFGAYEWVNYFENISDKPTGILSQLWDCEFVMALDQEELPRPSAYVRDRETATKIYAASGSTCVAEEFYCYVDRSQGHHINHIIPGETKEYSNKGGRSSDKMAPFFNVFKKNRGVICAIGWTGQWNCRIQRTQEDIIIKTKIEDTHFRIMPGESFRTSSVVLMPYECESADAADMIQAVNRWRRMVREEFSLIGSQGRDANGPLCGCIWGGMKTETVLKRISAMKESEIPYEYIWMDAGWYGIDTLPTPSEFEGDWAEHTGDWRVSPLIHPNGLVDVTQAVHEAGMKFLLWIEPERVIHNTPIVSEHPEYFLDSDCPQMPSRLLNLGNTDAWNYCCNMLTDLIQRLQIDCYRQDFNMEPLEFWRKQDEVDRRGITEIKHINGLYRLWDALLERFPHLIIDNCASGGRRIDIETLRRSIPLWRSDFTCAANYDVEVTQCHNLAYNQWMPYSGGGTGRIYDEYRIRSAYAGSLNMQHSFSESDKFGDDPEKMQWLKKYAAEYLQVRPYFYEDFYPLTEVSDRLDVWAAMQFNRPEKNDGILQIFRREKSPYESACFHLGGLDENCNYVFKDADAEETFMISGRELAEKGFCVVLPERRKAKIYFYHAAE